MAKLLDARKVRRDSEIDVDLGDDTYVTCRKEDMTLLVFEGRVPMPMLAAVQKMVEMPNASAVDRIEALGAENGRSLVDVMRQHACKVAVRPRIVMVDDGNPDHLPVEYLDTPRLMAIWSATAIVPQVGAAAAATFRRRADADAPDDVQPSEDVPAEPVLVAAPRAVERLVTQ